MSNRRNFLKQVIIGGSAVSIGLMSKEAFASDELAKLTVVHTNDMHCHLDPFPLTDAEYPGRGGLVKLASIVASYRKENPNMLLFDAGDMFQGTPYFNYFKGNLIVRLMSQMGYDAGTIGNHEFDNGLDDILSAVDAAKFPIISSNYNFSDTILAGKIKDHHVISKNGLKIGIYGLGIELDGLVSRVNYGNARYLDPLATALKKEKELKLDHKCDLVFCLSHLGYSYENDKISDTKLAPKTRFTDLIIGGHTHSFLDKPAVLRNEQGNPVIVNQAGWAALAVGKIDFIFDRSKNLKGHRAEVTSL